MHTSYRTGFIHAIAFDRSNRYKGSYRSHRTQRTTSTLETCCTKVYETKRNAVLVVPRPSPYPRTTTACCFNTEWVDCSTNVNRCTGDAESIFRYVELLLAPVTVSYSREGKCLIYPHHNHGDIPTHGSRLRHLARTNANQKWCYRSKCFGTSCSCELLSPQSYMLQHH